MNRLLVTWFGCGYLRPAPGTWGSLGAIVPVAAAWLLWWSATGAAPPAWLYVSACVLGSLLAYAVGVALGPWATAYFEKHPPPASFGKEPKAAAKDPSAFVLDEVAGQWLALAFVPAATPTQFLFAAGVAFFTFRLFDVLKVWPAQRLEKLPHGWGICTDDLVAGVNAGLASYLIFWQLQVLTGQAMLNALPPA